MDIPKDPVETHFNDLLRLVPRAKGAPAPAIAQGDSVIMLQLIRMKLDHFNQPIDPQNPGKFRGVKQIGTDMREVLGEQARYHFSAWGSTHLRGALPPSKSHLSGLIALLNEYANGETSLAEVYRNCIHRHHDFWGSRSIIPELQPADHWQQSIISLLAAPAFGKLQQGMVFSVLRVAYGDKLKVTTKKTYAADDQSSRSGRLLRGDVQLWDGDSLKLAVEVKDDVVDRKSWERIQKTHERHDYPLYVVAKRFSPTGLQLEVCGVASTYAVHLIDFVVSTMVTASVLQAKSGQEILRNVIELYNREFCLSIERDQSIMVSADARPTTS